MSIEGVEDLWNRKEGDGDSKRNAILPIKRRTRSGCIRCKLRHIKCDVKEPTCQQCLKLGFQCEVQSFGTAKRYPEGYPRLALYMETDSDSTLVPRFGNLHARSLLYKQVKLSELEAQLDRFDKDNQAKLRASEETKSRAKLMAFIIEEEVWKDSFASACEWYSRYLQMKFKETWHLLASSLRGLETHTTRPRPGDLVAVFDFVFTVAKLCKTIQNVTLVDIVDKLDDMDLLKSQLDEERTALNQIVFAALGWVTIGIELKPVSKRWDEESRRTAGRFSPEAIDLEQDPRRLLKDNKVNRAPASPDSPSFWKKVFARTGNFKRKGVRISLGDVECIARADKGADRDIMTEDFAKEHGMVVHRGDGDKVPFKTGVGSYVESTGRTYVPLRLFGDGQTTEHRWFHVLAKCAVPLILGQEFLNKVKLFTKNKHLLIDYPHIAGTIPMLKWIGSPKERINFVADGRSLCAGADTGSDLDLMSLHCARKRGFKIDTRSVARTRVMAADGTIVETIGQVHISSVKLSQFDSFGMSFHVLPGLPCDAIFGEEFLDQMDAFNTCDILQSDDSLIHSLNTLINLGPLQSFLSRTWKSKPENSAQKEHDSAIEFEIYRRNKANRSLAKIKDEARALIEGGIEEEKRRVFDRGHLRCIHCTGAGAMTTSTERGSRNEDGRGGVSGGGVGD